MGRKASLFVQIWTCVCLYSTLMVIFNGKVAAAAPLVVVNFNDTRCTDGGGVCSTDSLLLTCTANEIIILRVTLPSDGTLGVFNDGTVTGIGTLPAGFSVESSNAIVNPGGLSYNYTLSLSIENASLLNGSMIVCDDNTIHQDMAGCPVVVSPTAPSGLEQVPSANTLTSATFSWQEPTDTGGIGIVDYTVNTNTGSPVNTPTLSHTLTGLEFETNYTVSVTATNECGLESAPSDLLVRIPAAEQPAPAINNPVLDCENYDMKTPIDVTWDYTDPASMPSPDGLVYPPITTVIVSYTNSTMTTTPDACADLSGDDTLCSFNLSLTENENRENYSISVKVNNAVGSNMSQRIFELFRVVQEVFLRNTQNPGVDITLNRFCRAGVEYNVSVNFGTRQSALRDCMFVNDVEMKLQPGEKRSFQVDTAKVSLSGDMVYCFSATLNGNKLEPVDSVVPDGPDDPDDPDVPTYVIIIIVIVVVVLVSQILLDVAICYLIWKEFQKRKALGEDGFSTCAIIIIVMSMLLSLLAIILLCVLIWKLTSRSKKDDLEMKTLRSSPGPSPVVKEPAGGDPGPMYQDPSSITHTAHPETGELYADVHLDKSKKKKGKKAEEESAGAMYQDPSSIQHQQAESGDVYAMPQAKKSKKGKKREESVSEEEKAAMYSMPDRKGQKAKSEGLVYADLAISSSSQQPPPPQGSQYADIRHQD